MIRNVVKEPFPPNIELLSRKLQQLKKLRKFHFSWKWPSAKVWNRYIEPGLFELRKNVQVSKIFFYFYAFKSVNVANFSIATQSFKNLSEFIREISSFFLKLFQSSKINLSLSFYALISAPLQTPTNSRFCLLSTTRELTLSTFSEFSCQSERKLKERYQDRIFLQIFIDHLFETHRSLHML